MKKLMYLLVAAGLSVSCSNSKAQNEIKNEEMNDWEYPVVEIIGEWVEIPDTPAVQSQQTPKKLKFNSDYTLEGTPVVKKIKHAKNKNQTDSITTTTMVYQMWDQQGDTITMISQSTIDPQLQDTVTWTIVALTSDTLKMHNKDNGMKNYSKIK